MINLFSQGPIQTVTKLNEIVRALNSLLNFQGDGIIKVVKSPGGYTVNLDINQLMPRMPKTAGGSSVIWATVVRGLRYADADAQATWETANPAGTWLSDTTENERAALSAGYGSYICRLVGIDYTAWEAEGAYVVDDLREHGPVYPTDNTTDSRLYKCTADNDGSANTEPGVGDSWVDYWEVQPEVSPDAIAVQDSEGYNVTSDLRNCLRWFHVGDIVPLMSYGGGYYFKQTFTPVTDADGKGSLAWHAEEQRAMAVVI